MRIVEAVIALPALLVAIAILAILGPSLTNAMIALGIANATAFFRLMRGTALEVREAVYVDAARVSGAATLRILLRHVLPNVTGPLTVQTTLTFAYVLLAEAGLSYIGLGVQPPEASWGAMLATAQNYLHQHPFMVAPPGLMIVFTVLAFNLLGDGLRDALSRVEARPTNGRGRRPVDVSRPLATAATDTGSEAPLLRISDLEVRFPAPRGGELTVVSGVGFEMLAGRTVGLVGRVRLRQVRDRHGRDGAPRRERARRGGLDPFRRARTRRPAPGGTQPPPRRRDRHDLPGNRRPA